MNTRGRSSAAVSSLAFTGRGGLSPPPSALLLLPNELLQQIGADLSVDAIRSLSITCRDLRQVFLPLLFQHISILSKTRLLALSNACSLFMSYIRSLNIYLSNDFFDAWARDPNSPLSTILARAPLLQSLVFEATEPNTAHDIPWHRLSLRTKPFRSCQHTKPHQEPRIPTFNRLKQLELRTGSINTLELLLRHTPNLTALVLSVPDGLFDDEIVHMLEMLRYVPSLEKLSFSVADWETRHPPRGVTHVCEMLRDVAGSLPNLKELDLRTRSFDVIDHTLAFTAVEVRDINIDDSTSLSRAIAAASPALEMVSWMYEVHLKAESDEYQVVRGPCGTISAIVRLTEDSDVVATQVDTGTMERPTEASTRATGYRQVFTAFFHFLPSSTRQLMLIPKVFH
ncbi:hypothetical protein FRB96_006650 [Tulasnella sp. 330]|nr:hypothetical protein FRB96_006650 [Tulasnella sp. 330]KAG8888433.1 hypothetical protein FRB98_007645 [Tulasnella sp. 332]